MIALRLKFKYRQIVIQNGLVCWLRVVHDFNRVPCSGGIDSEIFANSFMDISISTHLVRR